jgi:hypothetical protein
VRVLSPDIRPRIAVPGIAALVGMCCSHAWSLFILTCMITTLQGCLPLWHFEIQGANEQQLPGVWHSLQQSSPEHPVRMLYAHGMGIYWSTDYVQPFATKLTEKLGLAPKNQCQPVKELEPAIKLAEAGGRNLNASLSICEYGDTRGHTLKLYTLLWAPLTARIKNSVLGYDSAAEYKDPRVRVNKDLKEELINDSLSDPLLYLSPHYQSVLQLVMRQAICFVASGNETCASTNPRLTGIQQDEDKLFIITESLASAMMYDTLKAITLENKDLKPASHAAGKLLNNSVVHYMFANQLPLLCLGRYDPGSTHCVTDLLAAKIDPPLGSHAPLAIVAFSDPNDLLTYPLKKRQFQQFGLHRPVVVTNVILNVEKWAWLFVFANPNTTHTGHRNNSDVIEIIACGLANKKAATCKENGDMLSSADRTPLGIQVLSLERAKIAKYLSDLNGRDGFDETRPLYQKARLAFNRWLAEIKAAIEQERAPVYEGFPWRGLDEAITECKAFAEYAQAVLPDIYPPFDKEDGDVITGAARVASRYVDERSLRSGARALWDEYQAASPDRKSKIIDLLGDTALDEFK